MNIAFVPLRYGSKSIIEKNIREFCGKPLAFWVLSALQKSKSIDLIVVATDSDVIESVVKSFEMEKLILYRRSELSAQDAASTEMVMLEYLNNSQHAPEDIFALFQATSPFTTTKHIDDAVNQYLLKRNDSMISCTRSKRFFWNDYGYPINYNYLERPRRQDFKGLLMENGAFYISKVKDILTHKNRISGQIGFYEMPEYSSIEIDEPEDWIIAERIFENHLRKKGSKIKLFLSDVDGTLTDAGMYYDEHGNELKKFNTHDGKGFELLRLKGIKTGIITSESTIINQKRAEKLKLDYCLQGFSHGGKLKEVCNIIAEENIDLTEVAYIGDDLNCIDLLSRVGFAACPKDAQKEVKNLPNIKVLNSRGGRGAVREFINYLLHGFEQI
jgi:YrbI family 3-deoxy-D-manno-octulosonate 8-phosphate phosphatase